MDIVRNIFKPIKRINKIELYIIFCKAEQLNDVLKLIKLS